MSRWRAEIQENDNPNDYRYRVFFLHGLLDTETAWKEARQEALAYVRKVRDETQPHGVITYLEGRQNGVTRSSRCQYSEGDLQ